ncbi:MAG TPA: M64 family metallopeptidase [Planctomycetota bacterium]|nr:M64 family metallopeptidase [Planctomycetota bacterium]
MLRARDSIRSASPYLLFLLPLTTFSPQTPKNKPLEERIWLESGPRESSVDILFIGDGYSAKELARVGKYWKDVERCSKRLFQDEPFSSSKGRFNVRALFVESKQTGCDQSADKDEVDTALDCRFDTRDGRLLAFKNSERLKELVLKSGQTDIVFVMVNTERYGGAGTELSEILVRDRALPAPTYAAQDTRSFLIALHELGHSFADLDDEYVDDQMHKSFPLPEKGDFEEANVSLGASFERGSFERLKATVKWRHFLDLPGAAKEKWFHEGGFFRERGVFRPWPNCRMRENEQQFCPICSEEVAKAIQSACGMNWDDAAWHKAHPLTEWH